MNILNKEKSIAEMRNDHYFAKRVYHIPFIDQLLGRVTDLEDMVAGLEIYIAELEMELDKKNEL